MPTPGWQLKSWWAATNNNLNVWFVYVCWKHSASALKSSHGIAEAKQDSAGHIAHGFAVLKRGKYRSSEKKSKSPLIFHKMPMKPLPIVPAKGLPAIFA